MNNVVLLLTVFVVLAAAGAGVWFAVLRDEQDRALSARIDATAPRGETPAGEARPLVRVRLDLREETDAQGAHVVVRVDDAPPVPLLVGWRGREAEDRERIGAHDGALARVREALRRRVGALGGDPKAVRARIEAPEALVASGEAVDVLQLCLALGLDDVVVETR